MNKSIYSFIHETLDFEDEAIALNLVDYLKVQKTEFIKDNGFWKNKIYYLVKYKNEYVCFIAIKDPDEPHNRWTVWSEDMNSEFLANHPVSEKFKEIAWKHVDKCGNCGSCSGGRHKIIFGKTFNNVCGCTFRFDNPTQNDLPVLKKIIEIRKEEIKNNLA